MNSAHQIVSGIRPAALALLAGLTAAAQSAPPVYQWTTLAGRASIGVEDGPGAAARFNHPMGLAFDPAGNLYVADTGNHTIRKLTPPGVVSTLAGSPGQSGSVDGVGAAARFNKPEGVAVDAVGNVYVADTSNYTIRKITPAGVVTTLAGRAGHQGTVDGNVASALFNSPQKIAVDSAGDVYVLDSGIRRISAGTVQTIFTNGPATLTSPGYAGPVTLFPSALVADSSRQLYFEGEVWLTQYHFPVSAILKMNAGGAVSVVSILPQLPWGANSGLLAIDPSGNLWATESVAKIHGAKEKVVRINTGGSTDDIGVIRDAAGAEEHNARGLAASSTGELIYSRDDNVLVEMAADGSQVVLAGTPQGTLREISSVAVDSAGSVWAAAREVGFSDQLYRDENEIATAPVLLKASRDGAIITPIRPGFIFACPVTYLAAAVDLSDNVYFAGIRMLTQPLLAKVAPAGAITSTAFSLPESPLGYYGLGAFIADSAGNLIIPDGIDHVVWKRTPDDQWSILAGREGMSGTDDGIGDSARFGYLDAITADRGGDFYVVDRQYLDGTPDSCVIRRITPGGAVSTVTENLLGKPGLDGLIDGYPPGIAIDSHGVFYLTHGSDLTVWRITAQGETAVIGGATLQEGSADGLGGAARFVQPLAIAVDAYDNLYVSDGGYRSPTIRKGQLAGPPVITTQPQSQTVAPGSSVQFSVTADSVPAPTYQWYVNGRAFSGATTTTLSFANVRASDAGDYIVVVANALGSVTSSAATLTVNTASPPPSGGASSDGGGGAMETWFVGLLAALASARIFAGKSSLAARSSTIMSFAAGWISGLPATRSCFTAAPTAHSISAGVPPP